MNTRTRRWMLLAIAGLGLVLSLMLLWLWLGQATDKPVVQTTLGELWTGVAPPVMLQEAYQRSQERAQGWSQDSRLVWLTASWRPPAEMVQTFYPLVAWNFYYYSPSHEMVATVGVRDQQLFWSPPTPLAQALPEIAPFPPPYGPDVAWLSFRAAGGETFLQEHAGAEVQFRLRQEESGPVWVVAAFQRGVELEVLVDATSGVVLSVTQTGQQRMANGE